MLVSERSSVYTLIPLKMVKSASKSHQQICNKMTASSFIDFLHTFAPLPLSVNLKINAELKCQNNYIYLKSVCCSCCYWTFIKNSASNKVEIIKNCIFFFCRMLSFSLVWVSFEANLLYEELARLHWFSTRGWCQF